MQQTSSPASTLNLQGESGTCMDINEQSLVPTPVENSHQSSTASSAHAPGLSLGKTADCTRKQGQPHLILLHGSEQTGSVDDNLSRGYFTSLEDRCTEFECYCLCCEPASLTIDSAIHQSVDTHGPSAATVLATGWPISTLEFTHVSVSAQECMRIYDIVRSTGVPNFLAARQSLPHGLNIPQWRHYLHGYHDTSLVDFLDYGFPVGFDPTCPLQATYNNHASALQFPDHVQTYLDTELEAGALLGPFPTPPLLALDAGESTHDQGEEGFSQQESYS